MNEHGYDAERGGIVATARTQGEQAIFACPACGEQRLAIAARFERSSATSEGNQPVWIGRERDLFKWFWAGRELPATRATVDVRDGV